MVAAGSGRATTTAYVHEAFLYDGVDDLVATSVDFVTQGLRQGEYAVVAVVPEKIDRMRRALGDDADLTTFVDMAEHGRNPARVIQVWRDLVAAAELRGLAVRGIGEPIWHGRTGAEIAEAHLHEALLNEAFGDRHRLHLRCPYDVSALDPDVVATARRSHPVVVQDDRRGASAAFSPAALVDLAFHDPLPPPVEVAEEIHYRADDLGRLREVVTGLAARHGMDGPSTEALRLSVSEIAGNSVRHGGGSGRLRAWTDAGSMVCELSDAGQISESMVGRLRPGPDIEGGRGVWLANQLCDLVQIRTSEQGTVVRLHQRLPAAAV